MGGREKILCPAVAHRSSEHPDPASHSTTRRSISDGDAVDSSKFLPALDTNITDSVDSGTPSRPHSLTSTPTPPELA